MMCCHAACSGFKLGRFAPIDTLEHVVWEARYMLVFILFMVRPPGSLIILRYITA